MTKLINSQDYSFTVGRLRSFFLERGWWEVHTQNRLSILAACEDPETVAIYNYDGEVWPLPQTGQMWLEHELLAHGGPNSPGYFCLSTSYRQEPNPIQGRHETIFPMFEFEMPGDIDDLKKLEIELCEYMGFPKLDEKTYEEWCLEFGTDELDNYHEKQIDWGMITNFPEHTSPFWNMTRNEDGKTSQKIDVILNGMETIGSAQRSTDVDQMRNTFETISDGQYAELLYDLFGKERVQKELDEFLKFEFFPRVGGGIGVTRMIKAHKRVNTNFTTELVDPKSGIMHGFAQSYGNPRP